VRSPSVGFAASDPRCDVEGFERLEPLERGLDRIGRLAVQFAQTLPRSDVSPQVLPRIAAETTENRFSPARLREVAKPGDVVAE